MITAGEPPDNSCTTAPSTPRTGSPVCCCSSTPKARPPISLLTTDQITISDTAVQITFGRTPIRLPDPVDDLARTVVTTRKGHATIGATGPSRWLFPGGQPGRPISTERLKLRLNRLGIRPSQTRSTALFQLATEIPAAILARTLGITSTPPSAGNDSPPETGPATQPTSASEPPHNQDQTNAFGQFEYPTSPFRPRSGCATRSNASLCRCRRVATAGERGVGRSRRLATRRYERGPVVAARRGVPCDRRVESTGGNACTATRSPAVGVPVLPCSGMPIRSAGGGRVLRDLPEGLPTLRDVGRGVRRGGAGAPAPSG